MITIDLFRNETDTLAFAQGQVIFSSGDAATAMYVVVEGRVDLSIKGKLVEQLGPGGVFGEMALIDAAPRMATAVAASDCKVVSVDERRFKFLVQQTPHFALQLMRVITDRLRRMDERL